MSADLPEPESSATAVESSRPSSWLARLIGPGDVHWRTALGIVLIASVVLVLLWNKETDDRSAQIIDTYYVTAWTVLLLAVWWLLFSGLNWQTRMYGLGGVIATVAGLLFVFRLDGFTGDFIPMFSRRWARTAEDRAVEYFESRAPTLTTTASSEPLVVTADDWPQFRGPGRLGISDAKIRTDWNANPPRQLWKHPVGRGWSSFAVVGDLAFTQEQRGEEEVVVCYDVQSGKQIWVHADPVRFSNTLGGDGPRGTPTVFDSRLYALGATGVLNCLDPRTGEVLWMHDILADAGSSISMFGMSGSPFIYDNLVVVNAGGNPDSNKGVIAYDRTSGDIVWRTENEPPVMHRPCWRRSLAFGNC